MPKSALATFGSDVKKFRGNKTLREAAKEAKVGPATLMRVESGRTPDVETFGKLCIWMGVDSGRYLGVAAGTGAAAVSGRVGGSPEALVVSAHLRIDREPKPETAHALARMILHAVSRQRATDPPDGA